MAAPAASTLWGIRVGQLDGLAVAAIGAAAGLAIGLLAWSVGWAGAEGDSVFQIPSQMGPYVRAVVQHGRFDVCGSGANCGYTARLPFVPMFHAALVPLIGEGMFAHVLVKNALGFGILVLALWRIITGNGGQPRMAALAIALICLNPVCLRNFVWLGSEEGYYPFLLLPALLVFMLHDRVSTRTALFFAMALFAMCLTKSVLEPLCLGLAAVSAWRWRTGWPVAGVAAALAGWSVWSWATTGHATYLVGISSVDGYNFFKGNNEYSALFYPLIRLDILDVLGVMAVPPGIVQPNDEWAASAYYMHRALAWLAADPWHSFLFILFKAYVVFLAPVWQNSIVFPDIITWPQAIELAKADHPWHAKAVIQIMTIMIYKLGFLATLGLALRDIWRSRSFPAFVFLMAIGLLAAPLVLGFSAMSHMAVLYGVAMVWLVCRRMTVEADHAVASGPRTATGEGYGVGA